jgi:hypothetical protein
MEIYQINEDIKVVGKQVTTFPEGIGEMFDSLMKMFPDGRQRNWYGVSYMTADFKIIYKAMAEEKKSDDAKEYNLESYTIEKGDYLSIAITGWQTKLDTIKDVFGELMRDSRTDKSSPCVEWYKTDQELLCLMKIA